MTIFIACVVTIMAMVLIYEYRFFKFQVKIEEKNEKIRELGGMGLYLTSTGIAMYHLLEERVSEGEDVDELINRKKEELDGK